MKHYDGTRYTTEQMSYSDYYAFGFENLDRSMSSDVDNSFGFNGMLRDKSFGRVTHLDYKNRILNPAIGRFLSRDPLAKSFPWYTPYQFAGNSPIANIDLDGLEEYYAADGRFLNKYGKSSDVMIVTSNRVAGMLLASDGMSENLNELVKSYSTQAFESNAENELAVLRNWATENRNSSKEHVMSLFASTITREDGSSVSVFSEGTTAVGEYKRMNPEDSKGIRGWKRSTTIHTHPVNDWNDFSNQDKNSRFVGAGDIQWSLTNDIKLYVVPPLGNQMGVFDPNEYNAAVIRRMHFDSERYDAGFRFYNPYPNDDDTDRKPPNYYVRPSTELGKKLLEDIVEPVEISE